MSWTDDTEELRRLLGTQKQRRVRAVPGGISFPIGSREVFVPDPVVFEVLAEREQTRRERQRINLVVRRLLQ